MPRRAPFSNLAILTLALLALGQGGCALLVVGAAAGAGALGYAYYNGSIPHDFVADPERGWQETQNALIDLQLPVLSARRQDSLGLLQSRSPANEPIEIRVEPSPAKFDPHIPATRVWVRVGTWGDRALSERIHEQIGRRLGQPVPVPPALPTVISVSQPPASPEPPLAPIRK